MILWRRLVGLPETAHLALVAVFVIAATCWTAVQGAGRDDPAAAWFGGGVILLGCVAGTWARRYREPGPSGAVARGSAYRAAAWTATALTLIVLSAAVLFPGAGLAAALVLCVASPDLDQPVPRTIVLVAGVVSVAGQVMAIV